jgi:hypothetical protein
MNVPSGFGAWLKRQQGLQDVAGSVDAQVTGLVGREPLS